VTGRGRGRKAREEIAHVCHISDIVYLPTLHYTALNERRERRRRAESRIADEKQTKI
jgi:hypothetical protein